MNKIRIHHFFDIVRDYGNEKAMIPHPYGHSYHLVGKRIIAGEIKEMQLVVESDDICNNCNKLVCKHCIDTISHREDFKLKEQFNNYLDNRIMKTLGLKKGQIVTFTELIDTSHLYLDNIEDIYIGNDLDHTKIRASNVEKGINKIKSRNICK